MACNPMHEGVTTQAPTTTTMNKRPQRVVQPQPSYHLPLSIRERNDPLIRDHSIAK
jgi:hypothetical protein